MTEKAFLRGFATFSLLSFPGQPEGCRAGWRCPELWGAERSAGCGSDLQQRCCSRGGSEPHNNSLTCLITPIISVYAYADRPQDRGNRGDGGIKKMFVVNGEAEC